MGEEGVERGGRTLGEVWKEEARTAARKNKGEGRWFVWGSSREGRKKGPPFPANKMTSPSVNNNNNNNNKGPIERAFEGAARDASLLLATVAVASTSAPVHKRGKGKGGAVWVPGEVVEVGRKAQASSVDSTAASKGWICVDAESGAVCATAAGRALVESMDAEIVPQCGGGWSRGHWGV